MNRLKVGLTLAGVIGILIVISSITSAMGMGGMTGYGTGGMEYGYPMYPTYQTPTQQPYSMPEKYIDQYGMGYMNGGMQRGSMMNQMSGMFGMTDWMNQMFSYMQSMMSQISHFMGQNFMGQMESYGMGY